MGNSILPQKRFCNSSFSFFPRCLDEQECRFYKWHPIDYSPAPLTCYMFRSCVGDKDFPYVAMVIGGNHPGMFFPNDVPPFPRQIEPDGLI